MSTPKSDQNPEDAKKSNLPDDLLLELGDDDEAELLPDHLVPEGEEATSAGAAPAAPVAPDKSKALQNIASQLAFAEAMASANVSKEFAQPKNTPAAEPPKQEQPVKEPPAPASPPAKQAEPAAAPAASSAAGASATPTAQEKPGGLKVPKFLKRTFEATALKGLAHLFSDDSPAADSAPVQPAAAAQAAAPAVPASPNVPAQPPAFATSAPASAPMQSATSTASTQASIPAQSAIPSVPVRGNAPVQPISPAAAPSQQAPVQSSAQPAQAVSAPVHADPVSAKVVSPVVPPAAAPPSANSQAGSPPQFSAEYAVPTVPKFLKKSIQANALKGFAAQLFGPEGGADESSQPAASITTSAPSDGSPVANAASQSSPPVEQGAGAMKVPRFLKRTFEANAMKGIAAQLFDDVSATGGGGTPGPVGGQSEVAALPPSASSVSAPVVQSPAPTPTTSVPAATPTAAVPPPEQPKDSVAGGASGESAAPPSKAPEAAAPQGFFSPGPPPIPKKKPTGELWNPYGHEEDESDLLPDHLVPTSEGSDAQATGEAKKSSANKVPKFLKKSFESAALKNIATQIWGEEAVAEVAGPAPVEHSSPEGAAPSTEAATRWLQENASANDAANAIGEPSANSAKEAAEAFEQMMRDRGVIPKEVKKTHLDPEAMRDFAKYTKTKEEERIKFELEFRSEPTIAKPSCPIENYEKASECPVKWDEMVGKSRVRFCEKCEQQVYDLSKLDQAEAEQLIVKREGKSDLTYYRRADGKWQVRDCPIGAAKKSKLKLTFGIAGGAVVLLVGLFVLSFFNKPQQQAVVDPIAVVPLTSSQVSTSSIKPSPNKGKGAVSQSVSVPMLPSNQQVAIPVDVAAEPVLEENGMMSHPYVDCRYGLAPGAAATFVSTEMKDPWDE